jgi:hypothetical protein
MISMMALMMLSADDIDDGTGPMGYSAILRKCTFSQIKINGPIHPTLPVSRTKLK